MDFLTDELLTKTEQGDIRALLVMDDHGLLIAPDESPKLFAERIRTLRKNAEELRGELKKVDSVDFYGVNLRDDHSIPADVFESAAADTRRLFGFNIDWVPGFFTQDRMGILFAGCAMYSYEDFFAVFLIRKSFKNTSRWFIYDREELMAHELTHIAHIGYRTPNFEEHLAFQTSRSAFRRGIGGMFRNVIDTYMVLGAMAALLCFQVLNLVFREPEDMWSMPTPIFFGGAFLPFLWIGARYFLSRRRFQRAEINAREACRIDSALPVLFRCSEDEIRELSIRRGDDLRGWISDRVSTELRWKVITEKFLTSW